MPLPCRNALMETIMYGKRAGAHAADRALSNTTVEVPESTPAEVSALRSGLDPA
jgi:succinate dehydrogenase/fumarate reductase flavoprotein subunit